MAGTIRTTTVQGVTYEVWSDFIKRCTFAKNTATGETKRISEGGYIRNDLTVRKAIAAAFATGSFRK
mgnify:CR=1 FL=1